MTERIVVVSNLHLAPAGPLSSFHSGDALARFLHAQARADTTVVFAGNTFDFLALEGRPGVLDMPGAPDLLHRLLAEMSEALWGPPVLEGLAAILRAGGHCVLIPGSVDPELYHPACRSVLLEAIGCPDATEFRILRDDRPLVMTLAGAPVVIGAGCRVDLWNDVDPAAARVAIAMGDRHVALSPGSRLVLELFNPLKLLVHGRTGARRFPLVDLLQPELPAVAWILLYLDRRLTVDRLDALFDVTVSKLLRSVRRALGRGPVRRMSSSSPDDRATLADSMAVKLVEALAKEDRDAPEATIWSLEKWLEGRSDPGAGAFAEHGGMGRKILRAAMRALADDTALFDQMLINRHLPEAAGRCTAIFGHSHSAREVRMSGDRVYVNAGSWLDRIQIPSLENAGELDAWIEMIEAGHVAGQQQLTYVEVTSQGVSLQDWSSSTTLVSSKSPLDLRASAVSRTES
jgi:UDP-2,3-diacylglucosamine pyrophosphatase LpxH